MKFAKRKLAVKPYLREIRLRPGTVADPKQYPFSIPAIRHLGVLEFHEDVTFLIGENGMGKSTILEAMAVALGFNAEGGSKNFSFRTRESHSELHRSLRLVRSFRRPRDGYFLRAESFFNLATDIEQMDSEPGNTDRIIDAYGGQSLHEQSHGESFMALLLHRFRGNGVYLLDEPEAALSPMRQLAALSRIHELVKQDSQFVIATHSPFLLAYPRAAIYVLDGDGIHKVAYEQTEHYQLARNFLNNHDRMVQELLREAP